MVDEKKNVKAYENRLGVAGNIIPWVLTIKDNPERVAFVLHRITGLFLIIYLLIHVFVTSRTPNPLSWEQFLEFEESSLLGPVFLWFLFGAIVFHGLNGLRLLFVEALGKFIGRPRPPRPPYKPTSLMETQRKILYAIFIISFIAWIVGGVIIFKEFGYL